MFGILPSFCLYYIFHMKKTLPEFIEIKKLRNKKIFLESNFIKVCYNSTSIIKSSNYINYRNLMNSF